MITAKKNLLATAIGGLLLGMAASGWSVEGPFLPPEGKKLLVVGQDTISIDNYVDQTGNIPGGVTGYISLSDLSGLTTRVDNQAGPNNMGQLYQDYPNSTLAIGVYMVNQLPQIISGQMDDKLDEFIRILKSWERPPYVSIVVTVLNHTNRI